MRSPSCAVQDGASFVFLSNTSSVPDHYYCRLTNLGAFCSSTCVCYGLSMVQVPLLPFPANFFLSEHVSMEIKFVGVFQKG